MKLSIITTITNPEKYQYAWKEALLNYCRLADEIIVVNGGNLIRKTEKIKQIMLPWPEQWHWRELPLHLNAGLAAATGDWVLKMDIDYLIREADFADLRARLEAWQKDTQVISFIKFVVMNRFRGYEKALLPFCINKKLIGDAIQFGIDLKEKTDWCYPIMVRGKRDDGVPMGLTVPEGVLRCSGIRIWDYDYFFRIKEMARSEFWRFAQAHATAFDESWGSTEEEAWQIFCNQYRGRLTKFLYPISVESHPETIRERVRNMQSEEFGYDNWGEFKP
jgi:glycosyltransferase involved in cell wall biosynthesis